VREAEPGGTTKEAGAFDSLIMSYKTGAFLKNS